MSNKNDGGPAFPLTIDFEGLPPDAEPGKLYAPVKSTVSHPGITARDYFATHTTVELEGYGVGYAEDIVGRKMPDYATHPRANAEFWAEFRARIRYMEADAMLKARDA
jgi:hypothetical protein